MSTQRLSILGRLIDVASIIRRYPNSTIGQICCQYVETIGDVSERTIRRNVELLESLGYLERNGRLVAKFRFVGNPVNPWPFDNSVNKSNSQAVNLISKEVVSYV